MSLENEIVPGKPERVNLKTQIIDALEDLKERQMLGSGEAHALGLRHADPYMEGLYEGVRRGLKKGAQMTQEVIREFRSPRVRDAMSRR